jgi:hypothetical protein
MDVAMRAVDTIKSFRVRVPKKNSIREKSDFANDPAMCVRWPQPPFRTPA